MARDDDNPPLVSAQDAVVVGEETALAPIAEPERLASRNAVRGSLTVKMHRHDDVIVGSDRFFQHAEQQLLASTRLGLELSGAAFLQRNAHGARLDGLTRRASGQPGKVAIDPKWGQVLWHTHPGLRASLAAFSNEDLQAAKMAKRPLLVVGFGGLSPDVLTTLALPLGLKGFLLSSGMKGLMSLEKRGKLPRMLLRMGVAARVCFPDGTIRQVKRENATPLTYAIDDVSFLIDQGVGAAERTGQRVLKEAFKVISSPFR